MRLLNALSTVEQARPSPSAASPTVTAWSEDTESDTENSSDGVSEIEGSNFTGAIDGSTVDASQHISIEDLYMNCQPPSKKSEGDAQKKTKRRRAKVKGSTFSSTISGKSIVNARQVIANGNLYLHLDK